MPSAYPNTITTFFNIAILAREPNTDAVIVAQAINLILVTFWARPPSRNLSCFSAINQKQIAIL